MALAGWRANRALMPGSDPNLHYVRDDRNTLNHRFCEQIRKEEEMQFREVARRWSKNPKLKAKLAKSMSDSELAKKSLKSFAPHFIDMNNNCPSPYEALREGRPIEPDQLLRYGPRRAAAG